MDLTIYGKDLEADDQSLCGQETTAVRTLGISFGAQAKHRGSLEEMHTSRTLKAYKHNGQLGRHGSEHAQDIVSRHPKR